MHCFTILIIVSLGFSGALHEFTEKRAGLNSNGTGAVPTTETLALEAANYVANFVNYLSIYSCCTYHECLANYTVVKNVNNKEFTLDIFIGTSFCGNNDLNANSTTPDCPLQPGLQHRECTSTVTYEANNNLFQVQNLQCEPKKLPEERREKLDITDPKQSDVIKGAVGFAVNEINYKNGYSHYTFRLMLSKFDHGTSEVLDGGYYNMLINLGQSECANIPQFNNATTKECPFRPDPKIQGCNVTVIYQPWNDNQYTLTQHCCK